MRRTHEVDLGLVSSLPRFARLDGRDARPHTNLASQYSSSAARMALGYDQ